MAVRTLIISHLVVLGAGVIIGKTMDAGELSTYRDAYESTWSKLRRKAGMWALGAVAVGGLIVVVRAVGRSTSNK